MMPRRTGIAWRPDSSGVISVRRSSVTRSHSFFATMPLTPGTTLSGYAVLERIGVGGMGEVYRARDPKLDRDVAIKVLPDGFARDQEAVTRLMREARLLASVNHPAIATLYGLEEDEGRKLLVMELVEGETLEELIERGPLQLETALVLFAQIAEGIDAAHSRGVIHRDLKPANIKVIGHRRVKILDFGLARTLSAGEEPTTQGRRSALARLAGAGPSGDREGLTGFPFARLEAVTLPPSLTRTGELMGTPGYMSPEQAAGDIVGVPSDIWAFGCCLFEALTGTRAFAGTSLLQIVTAIIAGQPDWTRLDHVPPVVRDLLFDCLAKNPRDRPTGARRLAERLQSVEPEARDTRLSSPPPSLEHRLFAMSEDMLCVAGVDGFLKMVNPAFERTLGWTASELYGRPFVEFIHEEDRPSTIEEMGKLAQGIPTHSFSNRYECRDGRYRRLYWTATLDPDTGLIYGVARFTPGQN